MYTIAMLVFSMATPSSAAGAAAASNVKEALLDRVKSDYNKDPNLLETKCFIRNLDEELKPYGAITGKDGAKTGKVSQLYEDFDEKLKQIDEPDEGINLDALIGALAKAVAETPRCIESGIWNNDREMVFDFASKITEVFTEVAAREDTYESTFSSSIRSVSGPVPDAVNQCGRAKRGHRKPFIPNVDPKKLNGSYEFAEGYSPEISLTESSITGSSTVSSTASVSRTVPSPVTECCNALVISKCLGEFLNKNEEDPVDPGEESVMLVAGIPGLDGLTRRRRLLRSCPPGLRAARNAFERRMRLRRRR